MRKKIVIIHFQPLELYPPVQNIIEFFEDKNNEYEISVVTTKSGKKIPAFQTKNIKIHRFGKTGLLNPFIRYINYIVFYSLSVVYLIKTKPWRIFYFETLSSYPAFLYKKYFNRKTGILIHYHEYSSPGEILQGMRMNKIFHAREKTFYSDALWVSHTNEHRMQLFRKDLLPVEINNGRILPNYPPANWLTDKERMITEPLKIVMIGALSLDTMYVKEFADWIIQQGGKAIWDIYSFWAAEDVKSYIKSLNSEHITLKDSIAYKHLPQVLQNYHVGVILYKGHIPNYIYNAPNKLFEYHVNGLDVWFPEQMIEASTYTKTDSYPKILPLNFDRLSELKSSDLTNRKGLRFVILKYSAETVLKELNLVLFE
jgi:hypothetical protein